MKSVFLLFSLLIITCFNSFADKKIVPLLKGRLFEMSRNPFFQTEDKYNLAAAISNKGNTTDLSLRELYWNTYQQDSDLENIIRTQLPDGSWKDINYNDSALSNWDPTNHVSRLLYLGRAYITPTSKFYKQKSVSLILHRGINYWFLRKPVCKNWWYNQIGVPRFMGLVFLFLENELTHKEKLEAISVLNNSGFRMTGQNKVWLAGNVLLKALLMNNEKLAKMSRDTIASEIFITTKEGIQPDFSFHQHGPQQQFGNYGLAFISSMAYYANVFGGTSLAFSPTQMSILRNYILDGENWVVWNGYMDVSACNRQMFKQAQVGKALTLCVAIDQFKQVDSLCVDQYNDMLKRNLHQGNVTEIPMAKHFWRSDLTVFRGSKSYISIRSCSPRVKGTEFTNNENKKGLFISDGCTIFLRKGNEYNDVFPVWDWNKIPGVTAPVVESIKPNQKTDDFHNPNSFVGGLTHDAIGISTFHLARNGVDAKKSWFYLHGILVCLGVDISSNKNGDEIITAVNQCKLRGKAMITLKEGTTIPVIDTLIHSTSICSVWHDSIGYYFPEQTTASISVSKQSGSWYDIADSYSSESISEKVFKLWINHGIHPVASSYEYMVLPAISQEQLKEYIQHPDIEVLMNSKNVQAVKLKNNSLFQFVFHEPTRTNTFSDSDFVETKIPGLVMFEKDGTNKLIITVADPTQTQKAFGLVISGKYASKFSKYNALKNQTELDIVLPQKEYAGSQVSVQLVWN